MQKGTIPWHSKPSWISDKKGSNTDILKDIWMSCKRGPNPDKILMSYKKGYTLPYYNMYIFFLNFIIYLFIYFNDYAPVSQANWCNITLQLVISSSLISVGHVKPLLELEPDSPAWEVDDKPTEPSLFTNVMQWVPFYCYTKTHSLMSG